MGGEIVQLNVQIIFGQDTRLRKQVKLIQHFWLADHQGISPARDKAGSSRFAAFRQLTDRKRSD